MHPSHKRCPFCAKQRCGLDSEAGYAVQDMNLKLTKKKSILRIVGFFGSGVGLSVPIDAGRLWGVTTGIARVLAALCLGLCCVVIILSWENSVQLPESVRASLCSVIRKGNRSQMVILVHGQRRLKPNTAFLSATQLFASVMFSFCAFGNADELVMWATPRSHPASIGALKSTTEPKISQIPKIVFFLSTSDL